EQRRAPARLEADQLGQGGIAAEEIAAPAAPTALQRVAQPGVEGGKLLLLAETYPIGRIRHHHPFGRWRLALEQVGALERHAARQARRFEVEARAPKPLADDVRAVDRQRARRLPAPLGGALDRRPACVLEVAEALEAEPAAEPGRDVERDLRRLDEEGAAAAHRVDQGLAGLPAGEAEDAGGEVLLQRRLHRLRFEAALVERLARGVEIEGDGVGGQEGVDADRRIGGIHARAPPGDGAEVVAYRVLDAQGDELQALQRRPARGDVDADRVLGGEPLRPRRRIGDAVDVLLAAVAAAGDAPHHAGGDAA